MANSFQRPGVDLSRNFIRGAARLVVADMTTPFPQELEDIIRLDNTEQDEVQTITISGTPTGGTFQLEFMGYKTGNLAYNALGTAVQSALELLSTIGTGGVTVSGSAGGPYSVTFADQLGGTNVPKIIATHAFTGGTTPGISVAVTTEGFGQYDAHANWTDLGSTKGGITVLRNNAEETFDVDQILSDIYSQPNAWTQTVAASVATVDLRILQYLWEGGEITFDSGNGESTLPLGAPTTYRRKRLAVLFQRQSLDGGVTPGGIMAFCFRITQRSPQESSIVFNKTGDQAVVPFTWNCLADTNVTDEYARFGSIIDQKG